MRLSHLGAARLCIIAIFLGTRFADAQQPPLGAAQLSTASSSSVPGDPTKLESIKVPDGNIDELMKFIKSLNSVGPTSSSRESFVEYAKARYSAQLLAADKILAAKPNPDQAAQAVRAKLAALHNLIRAHDLAAVQRLKEMPAEMAKLGLNDILLAVNWSILEGHVNGMLTASGEEQQEIAGEVEKVLKDGPVDGSSMHLAFAAASRLEFSGNVKLAAQAYETYGKLLLANADQHIVAEGNMMLGAARRLNLVGKQFHLEGKTYDGKTFDWKDYRGKVVLVNFFVVTSASSHMNLAAIRKNYERYHSRGFEVVTVCIDRDRKIVDDFMEREKLPWTTLLDNTEANGTNKAMGTYYGVFGVSQSMLVGKDGKVIALNPDERTLSKTLAKLPN